MKKRIISSALAAIMAVSALSVSAFALDKPDGSLTGTGVAAVPTLKVTLPKSLNFVINPYKLTVNATGKIVTEDGLGSTQIVPVYGGEATSWAITNNSGIALVPFVYATVKNGNSSAVSIVDVNNSNKDVDTGEAPAATKRQIHLKLMAGTATLQFTKETPTAWKKADGTAETGVTKLADIANGGTLELKLDTSASKTVESTPGTTWTAKDTATINVFFKFDFKTPTA